MNNTLAPRAMPARADLISVRNVGNAPLGQESHPLSIYGINDRSALPLALRRIADDNSGILQHHEMLVETGPAHRYMTQQNPNGAGPVRGQASQDFNLRPVPHECNRHFNVRRKIGLNESGHPSILPDHCNQCPTPFQTL